MTPMKANLLILLLPIAGCLAPAPDEGPLPPPTTEWPVTFARTWETNETFSGVIFALTEHAQYKVEMRNNTTWTGVPAYHLQLHTVEGTAPLNLLNENSGRQGDTVCARPTTVRVLSDCPLQPIHDEGGFAVGGGLGPGTYMAQAMAAGANTTLKFTATFSVPPSRFETFEGHARLLVTEGQGSENVRIARLNWTSGTTFFAVPQTAGGGGVDALLNITIQGPDRNQTLVGTGTGWRLGNLTGRVVGQVFPGGPGDWSVTAQVRQGTNASRGPTAMLVSILESPPYVFPDGTLMAFGPEVFDPRDYTAYDFRRSFAEWKASQSASSGGPR